jgi:hypothetical protein
MPPHQVTLLPQRFDVKFAGIVAQVFRSVKRKKWKNNQKTEKQLQNNLFF